MNALTLSPRQSRATLVTWFQTGIAAIVAAPLALLFGSFAVAGLFFSHSVVAAVVSLCYLAASSLIPFAIFRHSLRRGNDRLVALKCAVYTILALNIPLFILTIGLSTM